MRRRRKKQRKEDLLNAGIAGVVYETVSFE